ncbi:DUF4245 domain-containing protein [Streptomyces chumphonensis]|nr:DUF4245 domain-containing protein [Streptomyces chumphonensis]
MAATRGMTAKTVKTVKDMVLSMAVIGIGAWGLYLFIPDGDSGDERPREISYQAELVTAERAAPYALMAPRGLDDAWRATSVYYRGQSDHGAVWHLGFVDPEVEYAAVEQGDGDPGKFVAKVTHQAADTGETVTVDGEEWARYEGQKYDALVLTAPDVTTVVTGTAPFARLTELADALEPQRSDAPQPSSGGDG